PNAGLHHDPVEDVHLGGRDDVVDGADLLAVGGVHEHALLEDLVRDRLPLIHYVLPTIKTIVFEPPRRSQSSDRDDSRYGRIDGGKHWRRTLAQEVAGHSGGI